MANRWFNQFVATAEKKPVILFAKITYGSSGAPTLDSTLSKGVVSCTRNGAGDYTFVFGTTSSSLDVYNKLLHASVVFETGSGTAAASPNLHIRTNSVATAGTCSLRIVLSTGGTATDPASGEIGRFKFIFKDSTAP